MGSVVKVHDEAIWSLLWTDAGIVTAGADRAIKVSEAAAGKDAVTVKRTFAAAHQMGVVGLAADPAGTRLVSVGVGGEMSLWTPSRPDREARCATLATTPSDAWAAAHSPLVAQVATAGMGGVITLWTASGADEAAPTLSRGAAGAGAGGGGLAPIATGLSFVKALAYSPDGARLAAAGMDGGVVVVDVETCEVTTRIPAAHLLPIRGLAFSHDGALLYTGCDDRRIGVWDVSSGAGASGAPLVCMLTGCSHWVTSVAAAPDRLLLAGGSGDRTVRLWDVRKREAVHVYEGHTDQVWAVAFNADGTRVASGSHAGALGIFSVSAVA